MNSIFKFLILPWLVGALGRFVNLFDLTDWISMESLRVLMNETKCATYFNTAYNKEFKQAFPVGSSVRVPLPQRFLVTDGLGYQPQPINRIHTNVNCDQFIGVHFEWDAAEKALKMGRDKDYIKREYIDPIMKQLANELDSRCALWAYQNTNNVTGVLGTNPTSVTPFAQARQRMKELAATGKEMCMLIPPAVNTNMATNLNTLFNPQTDISKLFKDGQLGRLQGFDWYEEVNLWQHTAGTWAAGVTVNGANQVGSAIIITASAGDTFKKGDVISFLNVNAVNPVSRRIVGSGIKNFVVAQDLTAAGGGVDVLQISPPIFGPGSQYQNVDALPANGAALTLWPGTAAPNGKQGFQALGMTENAFALVGLEMELPEAVEISSRARDPQTGIAISFIRQWDSLLYRMTNRFDMLFGFGNLYPDNCAVRVACA